MANDPLEKIWDGLLSQAPHQIQSIFTSLDTQSQRSVLHHLQRMLDEKGWFPVQKQSAQIALNALQNVTMANDHSQE